MSDEGEEEAASDRPRNKVARLIEKYGLEGLGGEMEHLWTASGDDRMSLRSLADYFNRQILSTAISDTNAPLSGEVENLYSLLTDDDMSEADKMRARRRLERQDVDVDELLSDFVSYQAIRSYLKDYRNAEYEREDRDRLAVEAENLQRLRGRTAAVTESKLEQLAKTDELKIGDHRTIVDISVICEGCGRRFEIDDLLERGRCECETE